MKIKLNYLLLKLQQLSSKMKFTTLSALLALCLVAAIQATPINDSEREEYVDGNNMNIKQI